MADNVEITQGSGTVIATDDISGTHYQVNKIGVGADGTAVHLGGRDLSAGAAAYVDLRPVVARIQVTPTVSSGSVYTAGDCVGGLMTITDAARASGGSGSLLSVTVNDKGNQRAAIDLLFFNQSVTSAGDNSPVAFSDGDMDNCVGVLSLPMYNTAWPGSPANAFSGFYGIYLPYVCVGSANLFCQAVTRSTPTYGSTSDLVFSFTVQKD